MSQKYLKAISMKSAEKVYHNEGCHYAEAMTCIANRLRTRAETRWRFLSAKNMKSSGKNGYGDSLRDGWTTFLPCWKGTMPDMQNLRAGKRESLSCFFVDGRKNNSETSLLPRQNMAK